MLETIISNILSLTQAQVCAFNIYALQYGLVPLVNVSDAQGSGYNDSIEELCDTLSDQSEADITAIGQGLAAGAGGTRPGGSRPK